MAPYRITCLAQADLEQIWHYTVREWSIGQADLYLNGFLACFEALAANPALGKAIDDLRTGYRRIPCGKHSVFYRLGADRTIEIIRVLHVGMQAKSRL